MKRKISRRDLILTAGGSLVSIGLPGLFVRLSPAASKRVAAELRPDGRPRLPPGQEAVETLLPMGGRGSSTDPGQWKLKLYGEVAKPSVLDLGALAKIRRTDIICDVHCVTGWTLLDARFSGYLLTDLMDRVGVSKDARFVIFEAENYTSNIPIEEARKPNVMLADRFMDAPLPMAHGAPLRALVPDRYFYKSTKWVEAIEFSAVDKPGYYERLGWSNSADPWKEERME